MAAFSFCWGCFTKLRPAPRLLQPSSLVPRIAAAPFHTTAPALALPPKKKNPSRETGPKFRESRSARINKKQKRDKPKPPAVGERRALRERIVLSNTNALEVPGMRDLNAANVGDMALCGHVVGLPMDLLDRLRGARAFKTTQSWSLFRRPGTLVRKETVELGRLMNRIDRDSSTYRRVITGAKGVGKSIFLTQAMTMALLKEWVVVTIPEAQDLTIGHTTYSPSTTEPIQYIQKDAVAGLLKRIVTANAPVLSRLHISQNHPNLKAPIRPDMSLQQLAQLGIDDTAHAWSIFQALWSELTAKEPTANGEKQKPFAPRPPMLVTVDGLAHWMKDSGYRNADYEIIHAHDLALVSHFLSLLSSNLPNGGTLLYSTSTSNTPHIYSFEVLLDQLKARTAQAKVPDANPYKNPDHRVLDLFDQAEELRTLNLAGLDKDASRKFLEHFALSGIMRERVDDEAVSEKWTLSGRGIIGELEKLATRVRVLPSTPAPSATATA
ncbi:hypothetical protein AJ79_04847 [Helicocarpus griseus UAMH5409]|uniref:Small ribosomal subunit protein mS29 n=1 Tax=Helicocarpus griseus UAMH5409 TaxID=1447875 RepID=A0A2B7XS65_9EURO|nr:hypothetical protein AJ79_04847 [Helicocarpus griseus UAMH5409]